MGIKAEVERSRVIWMQDVEERDLSGGGGDDEDVEEDGEGGVGAGKEKGLNEWVELSVEIPGFRDDDSMPVFLSAMLSEALLADGEFTRRLWINRRFHWKLYLDVSHSLPLLYLKNMESNRGRFYSSRNLCPILYPSCRSQPTSPSSLPDSQNSNLRAMKIHCSMTIGTLRSSYTLEQQGKHTADHQSHFSSWL